MLGSKAQVFMCLFAGSWHVTCREMCEPGECLGRFFGRLTDAWHLQAAADDFGDLPKGYAFFGHAVMTSACSAFFKCKPEQMSSIEPVNGRPAVEALADVCRSSFLTRHIDESRHKAVIAIAVDRWWKPDN